MVNASDERAKFSASAHEVTAAKTSGGANRRRDRRLALALAVVFGLVTLSIAMQRQDGFVRYAKVRELTVEFTRLVQQLEKPSAWGF